MGAGAAEESSEKQKKFMHAYNDFNFREFGEAKARRGRRAVTSPNAFTTVAAMTTAQTERWSFFPVHSYQCLRLSADSKCPLSILKYSPDERELLARAYGDGWGGNDLPFIIPKIDREND